MDPWKPWKKKSLNLNHHLFDIIYLYLPIFFLLSHLPLLNASSGCKNTNKHPGSSKLSSDCVQIHRVYFAAQWTLRTKGQLLTFSPLEGAHTYFARQESVNNESERALHNRVPKKKIPWKKNGFRLDSTDTSSLNIHWTHRKYLLCICVLLYLRKISHTPPH